MKKHKVVLSGIFLAVLIIGIAVIVSNESISLRELIGSLQDLSPRIMSLVALPVVALLFVLGTFLRKRSEEQKWKKALLKTRAKRSKPEDIAAKKRL